MKRQEKLRYLAAGGWAWVLFSVVAVLLRGVRWEENYEFAQVLLGWIPYPKYFPIYQHAHNSLSLQAYLTALLMQIEPAPWFACGVRNVLYLIAKTLPIYLLGAALTRRVAWGHVAAVLALFAGNEFTARYPSLPWPMFAGNGAIGAGFALLALACFAWGWIGRAYCLTMLMPAVHVGQLPPLATVAAIHGLSLLRYRRREKIGRAVWGGAAGLVGTAAALTVFLLARAPETAMEVLAEGGVSSQSIWRSYMEHFPSHRALAWDRDQVALAWTFLLALAVARLHRSGPWPWTAYYSLTVCLVVWGIMAIHWHLGLDIPYLLLAWMPYRLVNHLIPLSIVIMAGTVAGPIRGTSILALVAIGLAAVKVDIEGAYVFLSGGVIVVVAFKSMSRPFWARVWLLAATALWVTLVREFELSIECLASGMITAALAPYAAHRFPAAGKAFQHTAAAAAVAAGILLAAFLHQEWIARDNPDERLTPTPFEAQAVAFMASRGDERAMIAAPPYQWRLQARLGHPITADCATLTWLPYHKALAPTLHLMYRDIFGVDLMAPTDAHDPLQLWSGVWTARSAQEWRALSTKYGFKYVVTMSWWPVHLPLAVDGEFFQLYSIE